MCGTIGFNGVFDVLLVPDGVMNIPRIIPTNCEQFNSFSARICLILWHAHEQTYTHHNNAYYIN